MKQVLFLYNPQSGKGKIEKDSQAIGEMFRQAGYSIVDGPISGEVKATTTDAEGMIAEGREIAKIHPNMVVKIPMTVEGLKAVKVLSKEGIKTNVTLIFTANQALLAARAGATYVSPFLGRLDDISQNGLDLIADIREIFDAAGDIDTQIIPFLTHINAALHLRSDTGERAEVYFVNSKDLTLNWGTTQRIMIPTPEVPSGIPVGMNGNMIIYFRDYLAFISKVAGIRDTYSISDVSERVRGEMSGVVAEAILNGERAVGLNVLVGLQANNRTLGKKMAEELDKELFDIGLGVRDVNIISVSYPPEVEKMAEKVAALSLSARCHGVSSFSDG